MFSYLQPIFEYARRGLSSRLNNTGDRNNLGMSVHSMLVLSSLDDLYVQHHYIKGSERWSPSVYGYYTKYTYLCKYMNKIYEVNYAIIHDVAPDFGASIISRPLYHILSLSTGEIESRHVCLVKAKKHVEKCFRKMVDNVESKDKEEKT